MIVGTGVDITEVGRIKAAMERFGDRFLSRVFTPEEARYSLSKPNAAERLAARFAAKEAGMKAIGTGLQIRRDLARRGGGPAARPASQFEIQRQGGGICRPAGLQTHSSLSFPHQRAGDCVCDFGKRLALQSRIRRVCGRGIPASF